MKIIDLFNQDRIDNTRVRMPYIIAEAGVNHEGSMEIAKRLVFEAKEGGADAIKFQTYKANTIASKDSPAYWDINKEPIDSQFKLFQKYDNFWKEEFIELKTYADEVGIDFLSTPFDKVSANFLNELMEVFKISSSDITNKPFIEYICDFGKPVVLSTGASNIEEIEKAVSWIEKKQVKVALLHCILNYPTDDSNANLGMIKDLQHKFPNRIIGYSDHTLPNNMKNLELATVLGSAIIEKHFTHDKKLIGNDHYHAMDMLDLQKFKKNIVKIFEILGQEVKHSIPSEVSSRRNARRSLVATKQIKKGSVIVESNLTWKRPAHGICPSKIEKVIGKKAAKDILQDEIIKFDSLS
jgi:sialic acid synthase SpsE